MNKVKANTWQIEQLRKQLLARARAMSNRQYFKAFVFTVVPYSIYVEFGTSRQKPAAMFRKSVPPTISYMTQRAARIMNPLDVSQIQDYIDDSAAYYQAIVQNNTPVLTGNLRGSITFIPTKRF